MVAPVLVIRGKEKSLQEAHVLLLRLVTVEHPSRAKDALNPSRRGWGAVQLFRHSGKVWSAALKALPPRKKAKALRLLPAQSLPFLHVHVFPCSWIEMP